MATRRGDTLIFSDPPVIASHAAVGGKKEGEGPLAAGFDELRADNRFGRSGWEAAEAELQLRAARLCLKKAQITEKEVSLVLAGDLQAQCTASNYAMRALGIPYAGLFGACSTMAEALGLGAALCSAGMADGLLAMASSHFCAAERQFRTPLSYGAVRTPTAQWTATAAGACLLRPAGPGVGIRAVTFGRVQDYQIKDINNMGAAMAPAAAAPCCTTCGTPTANRRISTPSTPATSAMWAASSSENFWPPRGCSSRTMWTAAASSTMPRRSPSRAAAPGRGAAPPFSAPTSCPGWSGAPRSACSSSPPGR